MGEEGHQLSTCHRIDGRLAVNMTLKDLLMGRSFPFVQPLSGTRTAGNQGLYTSVPVCYTERIRMSFWHATMYNGRYCVGIATSCQGERDNISLQC